MNRNISGFTTDRYGGDTECNETEQVTGDISQGILQTHMIRVKTDETMNYREHNISP